MVFYCQLCQGSVERGEGGEGRGVMVTWRMAVNKFIEEAFIKVSRVSISQRATCIYRVGI